MKKYFPICAAVVTLWTISFNTVWAVTAVNPTGVNVRTNAPNTVFLTFQSIDVNERAVEALWCGAVQSGISAGSVSSTDPCLPGTLFGRLPLNFDRSQDSRGHINQRNLTDIMVIPQSVVRRAVQEGIQGKNSDFFYVRRFVGGTSGEKWVVVTCRLGAGGARTPLSLIDVKVVFDGQSDQSRFYAVKSGERLPRMHADIQYNGTGQIKGRWELVRPGDIEPETQDLLTEASLPSELRNSQKRYQTVGRFSKFVPPNGNLRLDGPDPAMLDTTVEGGYQLLLRIEATDDKEANSEIGGGQTVASGGVAGFAMPTLKYFVGDVARANAAVNTAQSQTALGLMLPLHDSWIDISKPIIFEWIDVPGTKLYRIDIRSVDQLIVSSTTQTTRYTPPPNWLAKRVVGGATWQVISLDARGQEFARSDLRSFTLRSSD